MTMIDELPRTAKEQQQRLAREKKQHFDQEKHLERMSEARRLRGDEHFMQRFKLLDERVKLLESQLGWAYREINALKTKLSRYENPPSSDSWLA